MGQSILKEKSYAFALKVVNLVQSVQKEKKEFVLTKQLTRSGTAIGALVREAEFGQSKPDFVHKLSIALKEANETEYWLCLMKDAKYIRAEVFSELHSECAQLLALLLSSVKTAKKNLGK